MERISCRSAVSVCGKCSGWDHTDKDSKLAVEKCVNSDGTHSSSFRPCPVWEAEKEMCAVKATTGVSYIETRRTVMASCVSPTPKHFQCFGCEGPTNDDGRFM